MRILERLWNHSDTIVIIIYKIDVDNECLANLVIFYNAVFSTLTTENGRKLKAIFDMFWDNWMVSIIQIR